MSKTTALTVSALALCALIPGTSIATQPPDVVTSDSNGNTAMGSSVMQSFLTTGTRNTAAGDNSLYELSTGSQNTAMGYGALDNTSSGSGNSALGYYSLFNATGDNNTAVGAYALKNNTSGSGNTAVGFDAGGAIAGNFNTAVGVQALFSQSSGHSNIAIGYAAAYNLTSGTGNIDIGYGGPGNGYSESNTIRIGEEDIQAATYIAGIDQSQVTGAAVYVTTTGQLGVLASSERYKTDVKTMADEITRLAQLRPVTFKLKSDPKGAVQYGLIAEEVDKVFPELVIHNGGGRIAGVRYEELAPMLLSQVQRQQKQIAGQSKQIAEQSKMLGELRRQLAEVRELKRQVAELNERAAAAEQVRLLQASR